MSHDVVDVDIPTILGVTPIKNSPDPFILTLRRIREAAVNNLVIFIGEIPHSSYETAFDIPNEPKKTLLERIKSGLSGLMPSRMRTQKIPQ